MRKSILIAALVLAGISPATAQQDSYCVRTFNPGQVFIPKAPAAFGSAYGTPTCSQSQLNVGVVRCGTICTDLPIDSTVTDMKSMLTRGPGAPHGWDRWITTIEGNDLSIPSWSGWDGWYQVRKTATQHRICRRAVNFSDAMNLAATVEITVRMSRQGC